MSASRTTYRLAILFAIAVAIGGSARVSSAIAGSNRKALETLEYAARDRWPTLRLRIEATKREVSVQEMTETFTGDVRVTLGDIAIRCNSLVALYASAGAHAAEPGPNGMEWIGTLVAEGAVVLTHNGQSAMADYGFIDLDNRLATLTGTIIVAQRQGLLRDGRLVADLATGLTRVESQPARPPR